MNQIIASSATTTNTTFGDVHEVVKKMSASNRDELVRCDDLHFVNLENVIINGEMHPILPHAQRLIANRLSIPHQYLQKCPANLQAKNMNHWVGTLQDEKELFIRYQDDAVRAVFSKDTNLLITATFSIGY